MRRLEAADVKVVPTGIAHGTVTAIASGDRHEITTLRRAVATDGRRATTAFADDLRADTARRDFTTNALYAAPATGAVHARSAGPRGGKAWVRTCRTRWIS